MRVWLTGLLALCCATSCLLSVKGLFDPDGGSNDDAGSDTFVPDDDADRAGADDDADDVIRSDADADSDSDSDTDVDSDTDADGDMDADTDVDVPDDPVGPVDLPLCGPNGAHPAVLWTGSEFAVGFVSGGVGDQNVEVVRFAPGAEPPTTGERITSASGTYEDVSLASSGDHVAVGWTAEVGGTWEVQARLLPDEAAPSTIFSPIARASDRDDAHVHWLGATLAFTVRTPETEGDALRWLPVESPGDRELIASRAESVGELSLRMTSVGPMVAAGGSTSLYFHGAGGWSEAHVSGLGTGSEGDVAELDDGSLLTVWLHAPPTESARVLDATRMTLAGGGYAQGALNRLPFAGSDPALSPAGMTTVMAFSYNPTPGDRILGLVVLDADGVPLAAPCEVPPSMTVVNDPDIACISGYCAVTWMEASTYEATDFITRVVQFPAAPELVCP